MDVLTSALVLYGITAILCGLYVLRNRIGFGGKSEVKPVGPSYWGVYSGSATNDDDRERLIKLHSVKDAEAEFVIGSGIYTKSRQIKKP